MTEQDEATTNAIRYALLQRLAPGIRHCVLGELQAIESLAELAARQLQADKHSISEDGMSHILTHTRKAVDSCCCMVEWLRPESGATTALGEGVAQCLKLAGDDWPLRGIEAKTDLQAPDALVDKSALRELATASLIALIDMQPGALTIAVQNVADGEYIDLRLQAEVADRRTTMPPARHDRKFTWADVQVLANAHGVSCSCQAHGATLRLRRTGAAPS